MTDRIDNFNLTITIVSAGKRSVLHGQINEPNYSLYLTSLYRRENIVKEWKTGADTSLVITFQQDIGFTTEALLGLLAGIFSLLFVSVLYTSHVVTRRQSTQERQKAKDILFQEREKAEKTLNSVQDAIITLDADLRVVHVNPAAVVQFNINSSNAIGCHLSNIIQFQEIERDFEIFNIPAALARLQNNSKGEFDVVPTGRSHEDFVLRLTLSSSRTHDGKPNGHILVLRDISHERRLTNKMAYLANHDSLTGCTNRYYFEQTLAKLIDELPAEPSDPRPVLYGP